MSQIIDDVYSTIIEKLMPVYLPPLDKIAWLKIASDYEKLESSPLFGALDGKHFGMKKPSHSAGSVFF